MAKQDKMDEMDDEMEDMKETGDALPVQSDAFLAEFELPLNELLDQFKTGDKGKVLIPVEVIRVDNDKVRFRKSGSAETYGSFKDRPLADLREDIGVVED